MDDEGLVLGENGLVVGALRIDPEFEHAAWRVKGTGNTAFALHLADVADVDDDHVRARRHGHGLRPAHLQNLAFGLGHELPDTDSDLLRHGSPHSVAPNCG